jgi:16S rRNA (adenine1518-N6/adenine1519-N6)-dimethyltransferase
LARQLDLRPVKHLGQNFVVDPGIVRRIVATARLTPGERVVEIGPGLGSLTLGLLEAGASVVAIEIDPVLAAALPTTVAAFTGETPPSPSPVDDAAPPVPSHSPSPAQPTTLRAAPPAAPFTVVEADALEVRELPGPAASSLVANLPYSVATKVLLRFMERFDSIQRALVMVQAEVAARLVAPPGSRTYGVPSAKLAWWAEARLAGRVPRNAFFPVPRVDSELIYLERRQPPGPPELRSQVFCLIDAAFASRRKTLRAALAGVAGGAGRAAAALRRAGIDPSARGETLDVAAFARLAGELAAGPVAGDPDRPTGQGAAIVAGGDLGRAAGRGVETASEVLKSAAAEDLAGPARAGADGNG